MAVSKSEVTGRKGVCTCKEAVYSKRARAHKGHPKGGARSKNQRTDLSGSYPLRGEL